MTRTHQPETTPPTHNGYDPDEARWLAQLAYSASSQLIVLRRENSLSARLITNVHDGARWLCRQDPPTLWAIKPPLPCRPHCCKRRRTTTTGCTPWSRPAAWRKPPWATSQKCCGSSKNASSSQGNDSPAHGPTSPCTTTRRRHASCNDSNGHSAPMKKPSPPSMAPPQSSNDGCARTPSAGPTTLTGPSCSSS